MTKISRPRLSIMAVAIIFFILCTDQLSKRFMHSFIEQHGRIQTWPLGIIIHENHGIIANLPVPTPVTLVLTFCTLILISWLFYRSMLKGNTRAVIGLSLVFAGAISNAIDRVLFGYVFDWILLFQSGIINIADIAIGAGILWYAFSTPNRIHEDAPR